MKKAYIAVDFGAGSGRVIAGVPTGKSVRLDEVHRFSNRRVNMGGRMYWDFLSLYTEMITGLRIAVEKGYQLLSIGIDTWGVDFGLIDRRGNLLSNPVCYRDTATTGLPALTFPGEEMARHYAEAGIQVMEINTLYRLKEMQESMPDVLAIADRLLFMPDLFSYYLTGNATNEYTIASTSELLDARMRNWNRRLIADLHLPQRLFGKIVMPGTIRGHVSRQVMNAIGVDYEIPVIAVGSHDTASAAYAVGKTDRPTAFLSSGTWSLLGTILDEPILTEEARRAGFSNEGAVGGKIKFLQNITGLWILQRLMEEWSARGLKCDYDYMISQAEDAVIDTVIDVDDPVFTSPADMEDAIVEYCRAHGLTVPVGMGEMVRVVLHSLAERYRRGIAELNRFVERPIEVIRVIGGGSRNRLLTRLTAEATGLEVIAGPVEATAIGNILRQISGRTKSQG